MIGVSYRLSCKARAAANALLGPLVMRRALAVVSNEVARRQRPAIARYLAAVEASVPVRHLVPGGKRNKLSRARRGLAAIELKRDDDVFDRKLSLWGQELRQC